MAHISGFDALEYGDVVPGPDASTAFTVGIDDQSPRKAEDRAKSLSQLTNGDTIMYRAVSLDDPSDWEVGLGTYVSASLTMTRTTILASSNSDSAVNFEGSDSRGSSVKVLGLHGVATTATNFAVTNWTSDVAMDCNAAADAEICDVLGTLIKELIAAGIIRGSVSA
jgi:hypothetical protein